MGGVHRLDNRVGKNPCSRKKSYTVGIMRCTPQKYASV